MLLQSHESFNILGEFDPSTGTIKTFVRDSVDTTPQDIQGVFDTIGGRLVLLFRLDNQLFMQIDSDRFSFKDCKVELESMESGRRFRVLSAGRIVFECEIDDANVFAAISDDPTPFVDLEDFDFAVFLSNLSGDSLRQDRIFSD